MFKNFPKIRPPLPENIKKIYAAHYKSNRVGDTVASSLAQRMESWLHRQVARDISEGNPNPNIRTLELGAGTLNQLKYEPSSESYDIVEPFTSLYENSIYRKRISHFYSDISEIPTDPLYDRITSIAVLEHICDLPAMIARSGLLLKREGVFRASVPNEGSFLWALGWKITTGLEFKLKYGLDYEYLMKHEHVNTADEIEGVLDFFFRDITCKVFGVSKTISLYRYYECRHPNIDRCLAFNRDRSCL